MGVVLLMETRGCTLCMGVCHGKTTGLRPRLRRGMMQSCAVQHETCLNLTCIDDIILLHSVIQDNHPFQLHTLVHMHFWKRNACAQY